MTVPQAAQATNRKENPREVRRLLVVAPGDSAGFQIAYKLPFAFLPARTSWAVTMEFNLDRDDLNGVDILVLCRCTSGGTLSLARLAKRLGLGVIYEMDDDLLDPPAAEPWGRRYLESRLPEVIGRFLSEADLVKTGSPELARRLCKRGFNAIHQPYAVRMRELHNVRTGPPYRIGYFGTPHHESDVSAVLPALQTMEQSEPGLVEFEFIGCPPCGWRTLRNVRVLPYERDYEAFLNVLAARRWTLGLAPLRETPFNEAKSDSKFRDYSAAGVPGIYADLTPYRDCVEHGRNGWLCGPRPEEWSGTIGQALAHPNRARIVERARRRVRRVNDPQTVAARWMRLLSTWKNPPERGERHVQRFPVLFGRQQ